MPNDTAASDLIAVVILIGIFVTAAAVVGVVLLSHPPGDRPPAMLAHMETEGETVSIYHDGGDPLERGHFKILVDGVDRTENFSLTNATGEEHEIWTSWKAGEVLVNNTPLGAGNLRIQIVGEGVGRTGSDWLLHEIGNGTPTETTPTPVPPVANFTANITAGLAPLSVQFTDTSTGEPTSWSWDFGDGSTSTERNTVHTYNSAGTYTVTLTVESTTESDTAVKTGYITVTSPQTRYNALLNTAEGKPGHLMPGGYLEFRVTGADSYVEIGSTRYNLAIGDMAELVIGAKGKGQIYMSGSMISTFDYDDVTLYINGDLKENGKIQNIYIRSHDGLTSTLTLNVPPKDAWTKLEVDGQTHINGNDDRKIILYNLMPGTGGVMNLNNRQEKIWFTGSITGHTLG